MSEPPVEPEIPAEYVDRDAVSDDVIAILDRYLPAEAADALRKVLYRARRVWIAIDSMKTRLGAHGDRLDSAQTMLEGLNNARQALRDDITALQTATAALEAAKTAHDTSLSQLNAARVAQGNRISALEAWRATFP